MFKKDATIFLAKQTKVQIKSIFR